MMQGTLESFLAIGLTHYLVLSALLFGLGILGVLMNRRSVIMILVAIELMLLAVNINLVAFSTFIRDLVGQVFVLYILTIAAAEAAIGLAILVAHFRNQKSIQVEDIHTLQG